MLHNTSTRGTIAKDLHLDISISLREIITLN